MSTAAAPTTPQDTPAVVADAAALAAAAFLPFDELTTKVQEWGAVITRQGEGELILRSPDGSMVVGLTADIDPISKAVILGFLMGGQFWPHAFPGLLAQVNRQWKERSKAAKAAAKEREALPVGHNRPAPSQPGPVQG